MVAVSAPAENSPLSDKGKNSEEYGHEDWRPPYGAPVKVSASIGDDEGTFLYKPPSPYGKHEPNGGDPDSG
jgi:hypothetical protein